MSTDYDDVTCKVIQDVVNPLWSGFLTKMRNHTQSEKPQKEEALIDNFECIPQENVEKHLPEVIGKSMESLMEIQNKIKEAQEKAEEANEQAIGAWLKPVGFFHRTTPALEALQRAGKSQAQAVVCLSECQQLLFQQQCILARCTKILFMLCCASLTNTKIVVREIQMRLKGASEGEISEMARNELQQTVQQLNAQIDLYEQNERLKNKIKESDDKIKTLEANFKESYDQISSMYSCVRKFVYIVLALVLGILGAHDFYAKKPRRGILKLCITLLSAGYLCWVSAILSIIDIIAACKDEKFFKSKWHAPVSN